MEYRIENLDFELRIVGKSKSVKTNKAATMISQHWNKAKKEGFIQELKDLAWEDPKCTLESLLGVCGKEVLINDDEFDYFMGVRYDGEPPKDFETLVIPSSKWAVFPNVSEAWKALYSEWLPTADYRLAHLPCIECYYPAKHKPRHELWVPVVPK